MVVLSDRSACGCIPGVFWGENQQDTTGQYYPRFRAGLAAPRRFESAFWEFHVWRATQSLTPLPAALDQPGFYLYVKGHSGW
jgi:hypothetical protein